MGPGTPVTFNTNSLQNSFIATSDIKHENIGTKIAIPYILAHANGTAIPFTEFSNKMITLAGTIVGAGVSDTDQKLDTFRGYFNGTGNLDIGYGGGTRRYNCVCLDIQIDRPNGLSYANFNVTLMCLGGFGQDITAQTPVAVTAQTTSPRTDSITVIGSAPQQYPVATITLNSFTGSGAQTMSFGNNANGQQINVTRSTWTAGDIVQIDCVNHQVLVNGNPVDFTGAFVELPPGAQSIAYSDTFSARNYNYNVSYYPRYL